MSIPSNEVLFKKRIIKGNIRKKESINDNQQGNDLNQNDNDDNNNNNTKDELDTRILEDVKLQQTMRNRKGGSSLLMLTNKNKNVNLNEEETIKTIESVMGTQYTSQIDYGIDNNNTIPHKKLMDAYINEKLGISNQTKTTLKPVTEEDKLYQIPDAIKMISTTDQKVKVTNDGLEVTTGIQAAWSTCIAEVSLPESFKLKNIDETKRISKIKEDNIIKLQEQQHLITTNKMPYSRFMIQEQSIKLFNGRLTEVVHDDKNNSDSTNVNSSNNDNNNVNNNTSNNTTNNDNNNNNNNGKRHSTNDNHALWQFKKMIDLLNTTIYKVLFKAS